MGQRGPSRAGEPSGGVGPPGLVAVRRVPGAPSCGVAQAGLSGQGPGLGAVAAPGGPAAGLMLCDRPRSPADNWLPPSAKGCGLLSPRPACARGCAAEGRTCPGEGVRLLPSATPAPARAGSAASAMKLGTDSCRRWPRRTVGDCPLQ